MDFGILYVPNKAAQQAAMGLGCFVFVFCILIPYIVCWAFIPLYLILLILGAAKGFKAENPAFTFLLPLAPFAAACVLCMFFWWAIPFVVNTADMLLDTFKSIFIGSDRISFFREDIPDGKCFLYFIGVIGGSVGSVFSIVSIGAVFENNQTVNYYSEDFIEKTYMITGAVIAEDFCPTTKDIVSDYKNNLIDCGEANYRIKKRFKQWVIEKCGITSREAGYLWNSKKWLMEVK